MDHQDQQLNVLTLSLVIGCGWIGHQFLILALHISIKQLMVKSVLLLVNDKIQHSYLLTRLSSYTDKKNAANFILNNASFEELGLAHPKLEWSL